MAFQQIAEAGPQRLAVQRSVQAQRQWDVVGCAGAFQLVQEPQPLLREGQVGAPRGATAGARRFPCAWWRPLSAAAPDRRSWGCRTGRGSGPRPRAASANAADQAGGEQRMTAEVEEGDHRRRRGSRPSTSANRPARSSSCGERGPRLMVAVNSGTGSALWSSLPLTVSGSAGRARQWPPAPCNRAAVRPVRGAGRPDRATLQGWRHRDVADQLLVAGPVLARHDGGLSHGRMARQRWLRSRPASMRYPRIFTW